MNRVIFIILALLLTLATISLVTFFGSRGGRESEFRIRPDQNTLLFAVTPWGESRKMKEAYRPLLEYMEGKTGKKFQLLAIEDYDTAIDNIVDGNIDLAILPPVSYVTALAREPGIQYISTIMREQGGKKFATYRGYLVALKSRFPGWTFDQFLKRPGEHHLGFVTKKSSSGYAYPMAMMKRRGIDPYEIFQSVTIFENHPAVTDAVAAGRIDLGATWEYNLEEAVKKHGDLFTIVYTSPGIPGLAWVASKKVDKSLIEKIREVQQELNANDEIREKLTQATPDKGWQVLDDQFYQEVKEVLRYVGAFQ